MATHFDALKTRYAAVIQTMGMQGVKIDEMREEGTKLYIKGTAASQEIKNKIWDAIKAGHPQWEADLICDIRVTAPAAAPAPAKAPKTYTVKPGDTLSRIAKEMYGDAKVYMRIFEANKDKLTDPDKIKVGQVLTIPE